MLRITQQDVSQDSKALRGIPLCRMMAYSVLILISA